MDADIGLVAVGETQDQVVHAGGATFQGRIRKNPIDKDEVVVAAFTGNSIRPAHGGDLPKADLIENVQRIDADLLFFSGDQVYDHNRHLAAWLKFGREFGRIIAEVGCSMMVGGNILYHTRNIPTAIALETSKGEFAQGIALGIVLLAFALALNFGLGYAQGSGEVSR